MTDVTSGQMEVRRASMWELLSQPNVWKLLSIPLGALVALIAWLSAGTYLNVQDLIIDNATTKAEIMVLKNEISMLRTDVAILKTNVGVLISNQVNMQSDIDTILQLLLSDRNNALVVPENQSVE